VFRYPTTDTTPLVTAVYDLACLPPTDGVVEWLHAHGYSPPATDIAMVYAGEGEQTGEEWWVVAAVSYSDAWGGAECAGTYGNEDWGCEYPRNDVSFLTNAPSPYQPSGETRWINIGRPLGGQPGSVTWEDVVWTGERLSKGKDAQVKALSCLPEFTR